VKSWYSFERQAVEVCGYRYIGRGPLFTQQYSQAWLALDGLRDGQPLVMDYFQNSVIATYAHAHFALAFVDVSTLFRAAVGSKCFGQRDRIHQLG